jgi:hypothetical protein
MLQGQNTQDSKIGVVVVTERGISKEDGKEEKETVLPKLKLRNQSYMHDYMFESAKKEHHI